MSSTSSTTSVSSIRSIASWFLGGNRMSFCFQSDSFLYRTSRYIGLNMLEGTTAAPTRRESFVDGANSFLATHQKSFASMVASDNAESKSHDDEKEDQEDMIFMDFPRKVKKAKKVDASA